MAATQLVIDTDIVIDYLRQRNTLFREAVSHFECALTAVSLYELRSAPQLSGNQLSVLQQLRQLTQILSLDAEAAEKSAELWRTLTAQGQGIGLADTLIAGICLTHNLPLLTRNIEHYNRIPLLRIVKSDDLNSLAQSE